MNSIPLFIGAAVMILIAYVGMVCGDFKISPPFVAGGLVLFWIAISIVSKGG